MNDKNFTACCAAVPAKDAWEEQVRSKAYGVACSRSFVYVGRDSMTRKARNEVFRKTFETVSNDMGISLLMTPFLWWVARQIVWQIVLWLWSQKDGVDGA